MLPLYALIDYFNVAPLRRGHSPSYSDHLSAVELLLQATLSAVASLEPRPTELTLRLYGGWHDSLTDRTTEAREILGAISRKYFPTRRPLRVFLHLADSLVAHAEDDLPHTLRYWQGLTPFSLRQASEYCPLDPSTCPLHDLDSWRRGYCPRYSNCSIQTAHVTESFRQKLVDTALVADTITLALEEPAWICPFSNDDDVIPGLIVARRYSSKVALLRIGRRTPSPYESLLERRGINLLDLEAMA